MYDHTGLAQDGIYWLLQLLSFRVFVDKLALNLILLFIVVGNKQQNRVVNDGSNGSAMSR